MARHLPCLLFLLIYLLLTACGSPAEPATPATMASPRVTRTPEPPAATTASTATRTRGPTPEPTVATPLVTPTWQAERTISCDVGEGDCLTIVAEPMTEGLEEPVGIEHSGMAEDTRLFVVERKGRIRIVERDGTLMERPFLDLSDKVQTENWEQGLLGLAFHPGYGQNGQFYVYFTGPNNDAKLVRYRVQPDDENAADPESAVTLLVVKQPNSDHNGGALVFGPEGYLYVALGDGGSAASWPNAQDGGSLLGSVLRLDVDSGEPYAVPPDNPFVDDPTVRDEIWVMGLRNPWRVTFDRETGDMYIADVGVDSWEEVDVVPAESGGGQNFGWPCFEGPDPFFTDFCDDSIEMQMPIHTVSHAQDMCSLIAGYVYRGEAYPALQGVLLLTDLCNDSVWGLSTDGDPRWQVVALGDAYGWWTSFGEDASGELYAVAFEIGTLYRLGLEAPTRSWHRSAGGR